MNIAFGAPGIEPRWTNGAKEGVGTAYAASCRVWFTIWRGVLTECYYPTVDLPQIRDLQFLITDERSFLHEEKRDLEVSTERLEPALGYRIVGSDPQGRYRIVKEIITEPHLPAVLMRVRLECDDPKLMSRLKIYALCAPHLNGGGMGNNGATATVAGKKVLVAHRKASELSDEPVWMALAPDCEFGKTSVGYVGQSDGWTDLHSDYSMDWEFDSAPDGNLALTGEILAPTVDGAREFTLALAFGDGRHAALTTLLQSLSVPFADQRARFLAQWARPQKRLEDFTAQSGDDGKLLRTSFNVLLAHEDKRYPGALIASMSIPWGEAKGDEDTGGYHLVWPRDMVNSATGLMAAGQSETAYRALIYLAASQNTDGSFAQNFWIDGEPYFRSLQLDEVAFPILLARQLQRAGSLGGFDPTYLVTRAARFLALHGPVTQQERWEEASGLSPSTLAAVIASLTAAAAFLRDTDDPDSALILEDYADWLEGNLDNWCATTTGELVEGEPHHYVRINPLQVGQPLPTEPPTDETYELTSQEPGKPKIRRAREVFDGGFLELVRYGIRKADDPLVLASVRVMDKVLRVETPRGVCFLRYNGDGYGQRDDGSGYHDSWGVGRAWPLLGGERGHYEIALGAENGGDPQPYIWSMEGFASKTHLLPEQIWTLDDLPEEHLEKGRATGSARPLAWAHAEYIKLLHSRREGTIFDCVPSASERYVTGDIAPRRDLTMWGHNFPTQTVEVGTTLRLICGDPFRVRWTSDGWKNKRDFKAIELKMGLYYADIVVPKGAQRLEWTFFYTEALKWDGENFTIEVL